MNSLSTDDKILISQALVQLIKERRGKEASLIYRVAQLAQKLDMLKELEDCADENIFGNDHRN